MVYVVFSLWPQTHSVCRGTSTMSKPCEESLYSQRGDLLQRKGEWHEHFSQDDMLKQGFSFCWVVPSQAKVVWHLKGRMSPCVIWQESSSPECVGILLILFGCMGWGWGLCLFFEVHSEERAVFQGKCGVALVVIYVNGCVIMHWGPVTSTRSYNI